jgi:hypothetical protein
MIFQPQTADAGRAIEELRRICFENTAARRDAELFKEFKPQVIAVDLNPNQRSSSSLHADEHDLAAVAAAIDARDRPKMRRMLAEIISAPAAQLAARSAQMRGEDRTFITNSDVAVPSIQSLLPFPPPSSDSSHTLLQGHITNHILSFCASLSQSSPPNPCCLSAAIARMHLIHSAPMLSCASRLLLRDILTVTVDRCGVQTTEKCGFGSETYELASNGEDGDRAGVGEMVFPIKLLLCCRNDEALMSMTGVIGCFLNSWLASAVHGNQRFVSVYVDAAAMGDVVDGVDVLGCILLQVSLF